MDKMKKLIILILVGLILQSCGKQTSIKKLVKGLPQPSADIKLPVSLGANSDEKNLLKHKNNKYFWWTIAVATPAILLITAMAVKNCCWGNIVVVSPSKSNNDNQATDNQQEATH